MGNYVITVLFVSVINGKLYFLDSGLRSFLFIISSKSTLEKKRNSFVKHYYICLLVKLYMSFCATQDEYHGNYGLTFFAQ